MNGRKKIVVFGGIIVILVLLDIRFGWHQHLKNNSFIAKLSDKPVEKNSSVTSSRENVPVSATKEHPVAQSSQPVSELPKQTVEVEIKNKPVAQSVVKSNPPSQLPKESVTEKAKPITEFKQQEVAEKSEPAKEKQEESNSNGISAEEEALGVGDPFAYASSNSGDYTPLSGNKHVGNITVKGIIRMEGEEPKAILYLNDSDRVHYVSKNSVVRVSSKNKNNNSPTEAYIVVKDIRNDEVELIQLERPDKVIIIR